MQSWLLFYYGSYNLLILNIRAVKVSALIYATNVAAINVLKYFNAINATSYRPEPLWKHSSVCSFVFKKNTIQQILKEGELHTKM